MRVRLGRTILTVLSIVIGVAAVVSVMVTTATTRTAYKQMFGFVTGKAALEVSTEGEGLFPENVLEKVASAPGVKAAAPILQRPSIIYAGGSGGKRAQVQLVGVVPELDSSIREFKITQGEALGEHEGVVLDEVFARSLKIKVGDEVKVRMGSVTPTPMPIIGFLEPRGSVSLRQAGVVLMPLRSVQKYFGTKGKINTIQIVLSEGADVTETRNAIAQVLPEGLTVRPPVTNSQMMDETLNGSEKGLQLATIFTLILAMFIILNTFLMNISERRRQLAILRAIGATRRQIMRSIVAESLTLAAIGTILGIAIGLGAAALLTVVLATVLDVPLPAMKLTPAPFILAVGVGFVISLVGALWPAYRAGKVSPLEGLDRVSRADMGKAPLALPMCGIVLILICVSYLTLSLMGKVKDVRVFELKIFSMTIEYEADFSIYAGGGLVVGIVMSYPLVLGAITTGLAGVLKAIGGVEANMARLQITRHMTRSSLTAGVLFIAGSSGLALAYSIIDNVNNVNGWAKQAIVGDFFVRAMMPDLATGGSADLPQGLGDELKSLEGVDTMEAVSFVRGRAGELSFLVIGREFPENRRVPLDLVEGDFKSVRRQLKEGQVVVGSVLAQRNHLQVGQILELETTKGKRNLRICGITNDYLGGGVSAYVTRENGIELLGMEGVDVYILHAKPEYVPELTTKLADICEKSDLLLHTSGEIHSQINSKIIGIDGFLWGMLVFEFVVAAFGVVNTLTMNVLEQTREISLLRIIAMTKQQVRRTIRFQALLIAGAGLVPGIAFGMVLAYVMNISTKEALGHEVAFGFHPGLVVATLAVAMFIVMIAAWFPARRATRLDVAQALHYE